MTTREQRNNRELALANLRNLPEERRGYGSIYNPDNGAVCAVAALLEPLVPDIAEYAGQTQHTCSTVAKLTGWPWDALEHLIMENDLHHLPVGVMADHLEARP